MKILITEDNIDEEIIPHFTLREFACRDSSVKELVIHPHILILTNVLRNIWGVPIIVTSCYRTVEYNARPKVGGAVDSLHLVGEAIDFLLPRDPASIHAFIRLCAQVFPNTIDNPKKAYVHCSLYKHPYNWDTIKVERAGIKGPFVGETGKDKTNQDGG